jgi:hypothetical protein
VAAGGAVAGHARAGDAAGVVANTTDAGWPVRSGRPVKALISPGFTCSFGAGAPSAGTSKRIDTASIPDKIGSGSASGASAARIGAATVGHGAGWTMYGIWRTGVGQGATGMPPNEPPPIRIPLPLPPGAGAAGGSGTGCTSGSWLTVCCTDCSTVWIVVEMVWAMLVDIDWFAWITSPSFPGLRIRIEIAVLHAEHGDEPESDDPAAGAPDGETVGQSHVQFQIQPVAPWGGARGSDGLSAQFHDQFQIQVDGGFVAWSTEISGLG